MSHFDFNQCDVRSSVLETLIPLYYQNYVDKFENSGSNIELEKVILSHYVK